MIAEFPNNSVQLMVKPSTSWGHLNVKIKELFTALKIKIEDLFTAFKHRGLYRLYTTLFWMSFWKSSCDGIAKVPVHSRPSNFVLCGN